MDLDVGANTVTVTVTAEDGSTTGAYTVTVSRADETNPPQLSSAAVDGADLTLTYSEALDEDSQPAAGDFAVSVTDSATSATTTVAVSTVNIDGSDVELTLAAAVRNNDTVTFDYTAATDPIKDLAGNNAADLDDQAVTNNTAAAADAKLDVLALADAAGAAVALSPVFGSPEDTTSTYTASVANEVAVVTVTATGVDDRAAVVIAPADADTDTAKHQAALAAALTEASDTTVTVTITAEDTTTTRTYTVTVTRAPDTTAPSLSTATVDGTELTLTYSEALDTGSEPAVSAFSVSVTDSVTSATSTPAVSTVDVTGAEVTLTLGAAVRNNDTVTVSYTVPDEANDEAVIQDPAGLNAAALSSQTVTNTTAKAADATLSALAVSAGETALTLTPAFDATETSYSASVAFEVTAVTVTVIATTDSRAQLTLPADDDSVAGGLQVNLDVGDNAITVTVIAEDTTTGAYTVTVSRADETDPPQLSSAAVDGTDLTLVYNEALNTGSKPAAGDFAVTVTDSVTSVEAAVTVTAVNVDGSDVELTLGTAVRSGDTVTFDYTPGTDPVEDLAANDAAALDDQSVTNTTAAASDATLDVLSLADAGGAAVALSPVFGSVQDITSTYTASVANEVAVVTVTATGADTRAGVVIAPADSDTDTAKHQVDLPAALSEASDTTVTVTVTAEDTTTTRAYTITVTRAPDTTAPSLSTATVDGTELTLTYSEALDTGSEPATSAFSVSVTDSVTSTTATPAVTAVDITGAEVTLTLGAAVRNGDTVTVSYTVPDEANNEAVIQDPAGLNAAALSSQSVTNNTAKAADATLAALAVAAGETTLALSPAFDATETTYTASVDHETTSVTVAATTTDSRASVTLPDDDDTVTGGVQVNLTVGANTVSVTVTAEDGSTTSTYTVTVSRADETDPPQLSTATINGTDMTLTYSEALNEGSQPAAGDFSVTVTDSVTSVEAAVSVSTVNIDGSDVELTLATAVRSGDTVTFDYTPGTDPIQDAASNPAAGLDDQAVTNTTAKATDATLDVLSLADAGGTTVALSPVFGSVEDTTSTYTASVANEVAAVTVTATGADTRAGVVIAPADSDTDTAKHQVDLPAALSEASDTTVTVTVTAEDTTTTGTYTITVTRAPDTTAPSLASATVDGADLVLAYSEALDADSEPAVSAFSVSVTDSVTSTASTPAVSSVDVTGTDVELTLGAAVRNGDTVTVSYTVPDEANDEAVIQDPAGLNAAALAFQTVTNNTAAASDATLSALAVSVGADALSLSPAFETAKTTYTASVAFEVTAVTVTAAVTDSRASVALPTDDDTVTGGVQVNLQVGDNTVSVTVTAEDGSTTGAYTVTVSRADETDPPQLSSATVDGTDLVLVYSEALNEGSQPAVGDFAVTVVDSVTSVEAAVTVTAVDVDGSDVELTLAAAVRHGDTVTFDYTPGTDPIQDAAANPAAALASQAVTNNTAKATDATLDVLALTDAGGTTVALSPVFGSPEDTTSTYTAQVVNEVAVVTVTATGADTRAAVVIAPADADADTEHHQAALAAALTEASTTTVTVTVTAEDTTTTGTYTITVTRAPDTTAPSLSTATVDGTELTLTYSETLDTGSKPAVSAFAVSVTDSVTSTTSTPAVSSVEVTGADVVLTLGAAVRFGDTVEVTYVVPDEANNEKVIEDLAGLNAAALASQSVTNNTAAASDATLASLAVSAGGTALALTPVFDAVESTYSASVTFEVQVVTVTAAVADSRASLALPADDDAGTEGVQVNLDVGANTVSVTVTAEDGTAGAYTVTVSRADETDPPQLTSAAVDGTDLVLVYSEALDEGSQPAVGDFAVTVVDSVTSVEAVVTVTAVDVDGSDVELTLAAAVRHGDTVTFDYTPGTDPVQDAAANPAAALASQAVTNNTAAASDATLDVLALADAGGTAVALSPVFGSVEDTTSTYTAQVVNEVAVVTVTATGADTRAAVVIAPADADADTEHHQAALAAALTEASDTTVTVTVTAEDNTTGTYTITVTRAPDTTAPSLSTATVDGTELTLTYSEALDTASEPAVSAFGVTVDDSATAAADPVAATVDAVAVSGADVVLTLAAAVRHGDTVTVSYTVPDETNNEKVIEDLAGLNAAALASQSVTNNTAAASDATLASLAVSAGGTALALTPVFDAVESTYSASVTFEVQVVTVTAAVADSRASLALPADDDAGTEGVQVNLDVGANTVSVTVTAEDGTAGAYTVTVSRADETDPPQLSTATVDGTDLTLTYSEALNTGSKPAAGDFSVSVTDSVTSAVSAVSVTAVDVDGTEVTLTLAAAVRNNDTVTFDYTPGTDPIQDAAANPAASLDDQAATNNTAKATDATLDVLALADAGGTTVALSPTFGSVEDTTSTYTASVANEVAVVTVTATGADTRAAVVIAPADSDTDTDHHQADLAAALTEASDTTITVTVTAEDTTTTRAYTITVTRAPDTTAPSLSTATVDGTELTLTYSEALDADSEPAVGAFSVSVTDSVTSTTATAAVSTVDVTGADVTLTLAAAVRNNDTVAVTYTVPDEANSEAVIQDTATNNAAALSSQTVTNNTAKAADATLASLAVSAGETALTLTPAFDATETTYSASVAHETTAVTVAATTTDSRASVTLPTDDDSLTGGVQVNLTVGANTVSVTVTAEDGSTTGAYTVSVSRADETDPPQLSTATVDGTELTLTYNEALNTGSKPAAGDFSVSVTDSVTSAVSAVSVTAVDVDGTEVTLTLAAAVRSGDTVTFDYTPGTDPVEDLAANDAASLDDQAVTNNTAAASDATLDVLALADAGGAAVALSPVFGSVQDITSTYTAQVANEVAVVTVTATGADTRAAVVIAPADADTDTDHHQAALAAALTEASDTTITVTVTAEDTTTTRAYTITVTRAPDTTAPSLSTATVDGTELTLTYSEALDTGSEPAVGAFSVSVTDSVTSTTATAAVSAVDVTGADVTLTLAAAVRNNDTVAVTYTVPDEANSEAVIQDTATNNAAALSSQTVTNNTAKAADATLAALAVAVGADALSLSPAFDATETTYSASVAHETTAVTVAATTTDSRASVTLPDDDDTVTGGVQVNLTVGANTVSVTVTAEDGSTTGAYTVSVSRADETDPPQLSTATINGTDLTLTYSEALNTGSKPAAGDFAVSVTDSVTSAVSAVSVTAVDIDGSDVTLTLADAVRNNDTVTVDYTPGTDPIQDAAANDAAALDDQSVTNTTAAASDATLDVLSLADAGGAAVALSPVFGSVEDTTSTYTAQVANEVAVVTVTATGADTRAAVVIAPADADTDTDHHQADLVAALTEASDTTVTVTVTAEDTTTTRAYTITVTRAPDTTAPSLSSATVDGTELTLTYSEALDADSEPAVGAFSVSVTDSVTSTASTPAVSSVDVTGTDVELTLAAAVRHGDTVTVSYTVGDEANNEKVIQDIVANNAAALASQAVTNNTAKATDATLSALGLAAGETTLTLSPSFAAGTGTYSASVPSGLDSVTVTATPADPRASVAVTPGDSDSDASNGHQVPVTSEPTEVSVTVTAEDGSTIVVYMITVATVEQVAPTLSSAVVNGRSLVLGYDEGLDVGSKPAAGDFAVSVTDSVTEVESTTTVDSVSVSGSKVTLSLPPGAVRHGDTVTLDYTPGASPIRDIAENEAAGLDGQAVTNNTAVLALASLSRLELSHRSTAVALSPAFAVEVTDYTATVDNEVDVVTVIATAPDPRASLALPADDNSTADGVQVDLVVGPNTITVTVTAEDSSTTETYSVVVTRAQDTAAPELIAAAVDGTTLVLGYDEDLDGDSQPAVGDFEVSVTDAVTDVESTTTVSSVSVDASEVTLVLAAAVSHGEAVTLDYTRGDDPIQDLSENKAADLDDAEVLNLTGLTAGLRALELSNIELSPAFSQVVTTYTASVDNPSSSTTVTATSADPEAAVTVTPGDTDSDDSNGHQVPLVVGPNTITVTVADGDGDDATTTVYTVTVTRRAETSGPTLSSATVNAASLVLAYSETLDDMSTPAVSDFSVSVTDRQSGQTSTPTVSLVSIADDEVTLTLATAVRFGDTVTLDYTPGSNPIQDADGDDAYSLTGHSVTNATIAATEAALSGLWLTASGSALSLSPAFAENTTQYSVTVDHSVSALLVVTAQRDSRASVAVASDADDDAFFDLYLGYQTSLSVGSNTITVTVTAEDGQTTAVYTVTVTRLQETIPPKLRAAVVDTASVVLSYNEVLDDMSTPAVGDFSVSVTDSATSAVSTVTVAAVSVNVSEVALTLSSAVRAADAVTLDYTPGTNPVQDPADNDADTLTGHTLTNMTATATDAVLSTLELSGVSFSPVFAPAVTTYSASVLYAVSSTTVAATTRDTRATVTVSPADDDEDTAGDQVDLDVGSNIITVTVTAEDGSTTTDYTITVTRANETQAPVVSGATVDERTVVLVYNEDLDEDSEPATADFAVFSTDSATGVRTSRPLLSVSVDGSEVTLTLTLTAAVRFADSLTVDYTPGTKPIQDLAGNDAAGLTRHNVTNITAANTNTTLSTLTLSDVTLSPTFTSAVTNYTSSVSNATSDTTVTTTATDSRATVTVTPSDADSVTAGDQINLLVGSNTITVTVTAEDGVTSRVYTLTVTRGQPAVDSVGVATIDWPSFDRGIPTHHNANLAKAWLLTALKYTLNTWWNDDMDFDSQASSEFLDLPSIGDNEEEDIRTSSSMALAIAVVLKTGIYDTSVTGVSRSVALSRALKLIRSLAYWHIANDGDAWGDFAQAPLYAAHAGMAAWMLWDDLPAADKTLVQRMVVEQASQYRQPQYYRDRSGIIRFPGDSKTEEQAWANNVLSLALVMMPEHSRVSDWRTSSIHWMLATYARPDDLSSSVIYHGHPLNDWLEGSNAYNDAMVVNHHIMHPDYTASGSAEFNPTLLYFLAERHTPKSAHLNLDRVTEGFVELEFTVDSVRYAPEVTERTRRPGGTIFRPGTLCSYHSLTEGQYRDLLCELEAETSTEDYVPGHVRTCLAGPPGTDKNVFYPHDSSWSKKRRPNLAMFVAQADAFGFDSRIDDSTLRADYWFACFARDVRNMQARHTDGSTWADGDGLGYHGREGQSAHYGAKAWLAYWIAHQAGPAGITYENDAHPIEFNRLATIEAEDDANTLRGNAEKFLAGDTHTTLSGREGVKLFGTGTANSLQVVNINAPTAGLYNFHIVHKNNSRHDQQIQMTLEGGGQHGGAQRTVVLSGLGGRTLLGVVDTQIYLNAGSNSLTIAKLSGESVPLIDRVILGPKVDSDGLQPGSGAVDGTSLSLAYPDRLDTSSVPAAGDFTVTVVDSFTGTTSTPSVGNVAIRGTRVLLTLDETVRYRDTVILSYTPGTNPLRAAGGQSSDFFRNLTVMNNTAARSDAFLELLELPDMTTSPELSDLVAFRVFSAAVDSTVVQATLNARARDSRASVVINPAQDADTSTAGHQVALAVGSNPITVTVTAEDGITTRLYRVTVTRIQPVEEPAVNRATVHVDYIELGYTEDLDESSQSDESDFTVTVVDSVTGVESMPSVSSVSVSEATVALTIDSQTYFDDAVTISYTAGSNPIRDNANNSAINLVDHMLTNLIVVPSANAELSGLELSGVDLSPEFDPDTMPYTATVASTVGRVAMTATKAHKRASVTVVPTDIDPDIGHQIILHGGLTPVSVKVTAEDGTTTRTYTIAVTRPRPMVTSAVVDAASLELTFSEDLDDMSVPEVDSFKVAVTTPATQRTVVRPVTAVDVDGNMVDLTLESAVRAGQIVAITYAEVTTPIRSGTGGNGLAAELFVNYPVTNETVGGVVAALSTLELSGVRLSPAFSSSTTVYSASVTHSTASTTLTATPLDSQAQVAISPADSDAVTEGDQVPLAVGPNTITVTVTAADAMTTRVYTVTVTRAQQVDEPTLVAASLSGRSLTLQYSEALDQTSEPAASDFSISVTDSVTGETSTPSVTKTRMQQRNVILTLAAAARFGDTATLSYTAGSNPIQDTENNNAINLTNHPVTNTTTRASRAALSTLAASGVTLSPAFTANRYMYSANVANSLTQTTITATPADSRASAQIDANDADSTMPGVQVSLDVGPNTITVTVTAEDRTSTHTYTIAMTRS